MRLRAISIWISLLVLSGCATERPAQSTSLIDRLRGIAGPTGPDAVFIEFAVIERPAGSTAVNRDVWANVDEQILPAETRALLSENALRAGVTGGMLSSELESMIANPKSEIGRRQRRLYVNNPAVLTMNGPAPQAEYQVRRSLEESPATVKFEQAKFSITLTPRHAPDGRITLHCVPEMEYQDKKSWLPTGAVGPGWLASRPAERYDSMAWEVTLTPREFLVIGTHNERDNWLGNQIFGSWQGPAKIQRLLVVRTGTLSPADTEWGPTTANQKKDAVVPIASQASIGLVRGQNP
jgi:hypothetical protein